MATAALETPDASIRSGLEECFDDETLYEDVDGQRVERRPMSYYAGIIATDLAYELNSHIRHQVPVPGRVASEVIFQLPLPKGANRNRRPDFVYVSVERWPMDRPMSLRGNAWDVVPDLAVEVTSPTDLAKEQLNKVAKYFRAGVRLVWIVHPEERCIHVYEAWNRIRVVTESEILDGGVVLPGFQYPLNRLFGVVEPVEPVGGDE
jgi:Uma2 family endonuclease